MSLPPPDGRPRSPELSFRVYGRTLHPDWFSPRAHRRVAKDNWVADVRIIERGHVVIWRSGDIRLTEALTLAGTELPSDGLLYEARVKGERETTLRPAAGVQYQTNFESERNDPEVFDHLTEEILRDSENSTLAFQFEPTSRWARPAMSRILVESRAHGLLVHTFHTFPEDRAIVRTQSLFETKLALPAK